jgi:hypothetical protein
MTTPRERALDRFSLLAPRLHLTGLMPDVILRSLEAVEEARDVLELIELRPDAHQLVSVPALRSAIARVDAVVVGT